jgi:hypothetical protein
MKDVRAAGPHPGQTVDGMTWNRSRESNPKGTRFAGALLHQEHHRGLCPRTDSNRRPLVPETSALSTELRGQSAGGGIRTHSALRNRVTAGPTSPSVARPHWGS